MADATRKYRFTESPDAPKYTADGDKAAGEILQLPDGRAGVVREAETDETVFLPYTDGVWTVTKTSGIVLLDGQDVYWDHSANAAHYKAVNDRDFYIGTAVGDATSGLTTMLVNLNAVGVYLLDLMRKPYVTTIVGTQALGGLALNPRGGSINIVLDATNEAQKVDALSVDGFANTAPAVVEFDFRVVSDGAGTDVDVSLGVANDTHATDADSITESVFIHLNANSTTIYAESDDGTNEISATDTTKTYTEGATFSSRKSIMFDMRDKSSVKIYVDGVRVLTGSTFNVSQAAGPWRLLAHVEKTAATDTYQISVDKMRARIMEQTAS